MAAAKALDTLEQSPPIGTPATPSLIQEKGKISSPLAVDVQVIEFLIMDDF